MEREYNLKWNYLHTSNISMVKTKQKKTHMMAHDDKNTF